MTPPSLARGRAFKCSLRGFIPTLTEGIYSLLIYSINILFTIILSIHIIYKYIIYYYCFIYLYYYI